MPATPAELYADLDRELANTRRILERVPMDRADWKPHAKSMSLGDLASHLANLPQFGTTMVQTDELDMAAGFDNPPPATSSAELLARFDERAATMREVVAGLDAATLDAHWKLRMGDVVFLDAPRRDLLREHGISHAIHHRAQLTVYLRMLDVPVPGLYGPSADDV
jgi:uncharacterized damage-inducible protein DinB